jgi:hypothetical protein
MDSTEETALVVPGIERFGHLDRLNNVLTGIALQSGLLHVQAGGEMLRQNCETSRT